MTLRIPSPSTHEDVIYFTDSEYKSLLTASVSQKYITSVNLAVIVQAQLNVKLYGVVRQISEKTS